MYFSEPRAHAVPLFISSKILPLQMLYAEKVSSIMFDVSCMNKFKFKFNNSFDQFYQCTK